MKRKIEIDKEFYVREFKDSKRILSLTKDELLWEIWNERANKLNWGLIGLIIGMLFTIISYSY